MKQKTKPNSVVSDESTKPYPTDEFPSPQAEATQQGQKIGPSETIAVVSPPEIATQPVLDVPDSKFVPMEGPPTVTGTAKAAEDDEASRAVGGIRMNLGSGWAKGASFLPILLKRVTSKTLQMAFAPGLYLAEGGTGSGKTVTAVALTMALQADMEKVMYGIGYIYIHEARATIGAWGTRPATKHELLNSSSENVNVFSNPAELLTDMNALFTARGFKGAGNPPSFLVLDSITLAIKTAFPDMRVGSPAGERGLQIADVAFVQQLNNFAATNNMVLIGTINTDVIQFSDRLEALVEGRIIIRSAGQFAKRDRIDRTWREYTLPNAAINQALVGIGYAQSAGFFTTNHPFMPDMRSGMAS